MNKITSLVESYLSYKQNLGFQLRSEAICLRAFAKYTEELGYAGTLTRKIVFQWCERDTPSLMTKGRRFEPIAGLAQYVNAFDPESETMPKLPYGNPHIIRLTKRCCLWINVSLFIRQTEYAL